MPHPGDAGDRHPEETCRKINLGYRDPATINPADYADREDEGILYVRRRARCCIGWRDRQTSPVTTDGH